MGLEPLRGRIRRELRLIWVEPPAFCQPGASPVTDLLHWEVVIDGPDGRPYAGGTFPVDVDFVADYPFKPPKITFKTKVRSALQQFYAWINSSSFSVCLFQSIRRSLIVPSIILRCTTRTSTRKGR